MPQKPNDIIPQTTKESTNMLESGIKAQGKKVDTQEVIKILETSPQKGDDKILIGVENLNAEVIAWAIDNNKKIPINTLD